MQHIRLGKSSNAYNHDSSSIEFSFVVQMQLVVPARELAEALAASTIIIFIATVITDNDGYICNWYGV